jgi:vanillate/4-hydroxybenzoate decarboxylase subunit D
VADEQEKKLLMSAKSVPVANVTGGSRGIGAAVSRQLAQDRFGVVVNYASSAGEATQTDQDAAVCPRCHSGETHVLTRSPVPDIWVVHGCMVCLYAWRNTEPEENRNPEKYPEEFRMDPADVTNFNVVPTVPPLRKTESPRTSALAGAPPRDRRSS